MHVHNHLTKYYRSTIFIQKRRYASYSLTVRGKKATRSGGNTIIYTACTTWLHASSLVRLYFIIICEFSMCLFLWCSNPAVFTTLWAPIWCFLHRVKTIMVSFFIMPALRVKIKFKRHYIQSAGRFRCMITHVTPFCLFFL